MNYHLVIIPLEPRLPSTRHSVALKHSTMVVMSWLSSWGEEILRMQVSRTAAGCQDSLPLANQEKQIPIGGWWGFPQMHY